MTITRTELFRYSLSFRQPLLLGDRTHSRRDGLLVKLTSDEGSVGWGETAPLPGFSTESLDQARTQLCEVLPSLRNKPVPAELAALDGQLSEWLATPNLLPAVRCGLEMAVLNLLAADQSVPLASLFSDNALGTVRINGLITGDSDELTEESRAMRREGYRAIKLKVGHNDIAVDIERTRNVYHELGSETTLRLDANCAWTFERALEFADGIDDCEIEYIEEPLDDPSRLAEFAATSGLRVALDESLDDLAPTSPPLFDGLEAVIIKPTIIGGFEKAAALAGNMRHDGPGAIISSSFESSVGIAALAHLAAAYGRPNPPVGLDTGSYFQRDLLTEPLDTSGGWIRIGQATRVERTIDMSLLTPIQF